MNPNTMQWNGTPGHYEVYYLTVTHPQTKTGIWIRYTMRAPLAADPECHLWFVAMTPDGRNVAHLETYGIDQLVAQADPFRINVAGSVLDDHGMHGGLHGASWDLHWEPRLPPYEPVHPFLRRLRIAKTVFCLPHADLRVSGTVTIGDETLELDDLRGGQAHLFGSKHASRWTWTHCNDFVGQDGSPRQDSFWEGVSVYVPRFGREIGPSTPIVARIEGEDFLARGPVQIIRTLSEFGLTSWHCSAVSGKRKLVATITAPKASLVGVTYHDPDGELAHCYNSEVGAMRLEVFDRVGRSGWRPVDTLVSECGAHFEYAQRLPLDDMELLIR